MRGRGSERTSQEERGPVEAQPRWKADTDRVREGMSEGCHVAEPELVDPEGARAAEPQPRAVQSYLKLKLSSLRFSARGVPSSKWLTPAPKADILDPKVMHEQSRSDRTAN
jgi:hypothetical protein